MRLEYIRAINYFRRLYLFVQVKGRLEGAKRQFTRSSRLANSVRVPRLMTITQLNSTLVLNTILLCMDTMIRTIPCPRSRVLNSRRYLVTSFLVVGMNYGICRANGLLICTMVEYPGPVKIIMNAVRLSGDAVLDQGNISVTVSVLFEILLVLVGDDPNTLRLPRFDLEDRVADLPITLRVLIVCGNRLLVLSRLVRRPNSILTRSDLLLEVNYRNMYLYSDQRVIA